MSSYTTYLIAATAAFSLISSASAGTYDVDSKSNVALYWGQGANQAILRTYCAQPSVDIIPIAFVNQFANTGDGILGENFGSACWAGSYLGPGYDGVINRTADALPQRCVDLQNDIPYCQANYNTKILISVGGAVGYDLAPYGLGNETQGIALAEMLWYGYGPYNATASGVLGDGTQGLGFIRPLDRGYYNTDLTEHVDVDGFDFDIETNSADEQLGYVACINHLRTLITNYQLANSGSKDYIISGAPQCPIPDAHMDVMIAQAQFDIIWVQFYNNDAYGCSARNYITSGANSNFNLNSGKTNWTSTLAQSLKSKDAKLYIGLPGGPAGVTNSPQDFLTPSEAQTLISAFVGTKNFGGVMLWEATAADAVDMASYPAPYNTYAHYYDAIKGILAPYAPVTSSVVSSTTSTSSSSSSTVASTTTSSSSITTSSSSAAPTSTSASSTSTSSSITSTSSAPATSSTGCSVSTPVRWTALGCYVDSNHPRALSYQLFGLLDDVNVETCQAACLNIGYTFAGVEYADQCWCGSEISSPNKNVYESDQSQCFMPCQGNRSETCGGNYAINIYSYSNGKGSCTSSVSTSASRTSSVLSSTSSNTISSSSSSASASASSTSSVLSTTSSISSSSSSTLSSSSSVVASSSTSSSLSSSSASSSSASSTTPTSSSAPSSTSLSASSSSTLSSSSSSSSVPQTSSTSPSSSSTSASPSSSSESSSSISSSASVSSSSSSIYITPSSSVAISSSSESASASSSSSSSVYVTPSSSATSSSSSVSATASSSLTSSTSSSSSASASVTSASSSLSSSVSANSSSSSSSVSGIASLSSSSATISSSASGSSSSSIVTPTSSASGSVTSVSSSASSSSLFYSNSTSIVPSSTKSKTKTKCSSVYPTSSGKVVLPTSSSAVIIPTSSGTALITPTSSAGGVATSPSVSPTLFTTSTVYATSTYTITSCAATVTDCPARIGQVITETIVDYTTICPVTESTPTAISTTTHSAMAPPPTQYTTSTVYATSVYTITSCAPSVTDCPARIGKVTTETVALYTTICPVAEAAAIASSSPAGPGTIVAASSPIIVAASSPVPSGSSIIIHTTIKSTTTLYKTVKMVESTATVMAVPYPTVSSASGKPVGTGLPSVSLIFKGQVTSTAAGVAATTSPITPAATMGTQFTGAGSREGVKFGAVLAVVLGAGALLV